MRYQINTHTVLDTQTGLMWQRNLSVDEYTFANAIKQARSWRIDGYTDWRMPTIDELRTLYSREDVWWEISETGEYQPTPDIRNIKDTQPWIDLTTFPQGDGYVWSSTIRPATKNYVWVANFATQGGGCVYTCQTVGRSAKSTMTHQMRAVRRV